MLVSWPAPSAWQPELPVIVDAAERPGVEALRVFPHILRAPGIRPRRSDARVRIFNVKYSPNLGDGLLSECLEQALIDCGAAPDTWSVDLAGRTSYGPGSRARSIQMHLLDALPAPLRRLAVRVPLAVQSRQRWRPHYRDALSCADCVVIGGGNLITDLDLNFPTKIALAIEEAFRRELPVFIYACGVAGEWSPRGRALMQGALDRGTIRRVFVRDELSRQNWNDGFGSARGLEATLVRDPGLLAAERYGLAAMSSGTEQPIIGINITCQLALRYHAERPPSPADLHAWYLDLARVLTGKGCRIAVFTNGTPEDRACALLLRPAFQALAGDRVSFPEPRTPQDLARLIAGLNAVCAFRMHALIAAYSCGVPFLGLEWDPKLNAFLRSVDRQDWLCQPVRVPAATAAEQVLGAMEEGIPAAERELVTMQVRRGIAMLQDEIAQVTAGQ